LLRRFVAVRKQVTRMGRWKQAAHLIRPALVFVAGSLLFVAIRRVVVPPSFGQYGHYRGESLADVRRHPVRYAGQQLCADCHPDKVEERAKDKHKNIACEACHGPSAAHAASFGEQKHPPLDATALCRSCHEADSAKPAWFKQVVTAEHSGEEACLSCHKSHSPSMK
jgi:hypothetical protein